MKILIIGGGIAGMAAATLLHRQGNNVQIVDIAPGYHHIGFGLYLWNFGREILDELGIGHSLMSKACLIPGADCQNIRYKTLFYLSYSSAGKYRPVSVYRADLHQYLRDAASEVPVKFNTTFTSIEQNEGGVEVSFNDGTTDRFDLVIGADGIHSRVRGIIDNPQLLSYGWRAYAFYGDSWKRKNESVQLLSVPGCGLGIVPLRGRHFVGFNVACPPGEPDPVDTRRERLHMYANGFGQEVHDLIDSVDAADIYGFDLKYVPMGPWAKGRVVLIGDARHAMSPVSGRGANVALEDASILAKMMKGIRAQDVPATLQLFSIERTKRVEKLRGHFYNYLERFLFIRNPIMHAARNAALRLLPRALLNGKPDPEFN